ncbi:MAG: hypothetical protein IKW21_04170 [Lachnospiraceae bacterium]|nr:hypothetical protein [Lachnospiraceae bacterium]
MSINKVVYGNTTLIDLTGDTVTKETLAEGVTAHNASGDKITGTMRRATNTLYTVQHSLTNAVNGSVSVGGGSLYSATINPISGYVVNNVKVTMGGTDITSSAYSNGVVTVNNVTGNIVITASAAKEVTNVLKSAQVFTNGNTSILESGKGYKDGYYQSSSGGIGSAASGYTCTGAIPYKRKSDGTYPTIYVKGCTFDATSRSRFYFYSTSKSIINPSKYGGTGAAMTNINTYLTKTDLGSGYWKLTPTSALNAAATLDNQTVGYMAMSLLGSGANLVITLDEPIE